MKGLNRTALVILTAVLAATGLALAGDPAADLYAKAQKSLDREDYQEAAEMFEKVTAEYPKAKQAGNALYFQALALYRLGDTSSLRKAYSALTRQMRRYEDASTSDDAESLRIRIDKELAENGDEEAARRMAEKAQEIEQEQDEQQDQDSDDDDRGSIDMRVEALNALMQLDPERAIPILRKVLQKRTRDSVELRRKAVFIVSQMESEEALPLLKDAIENDSDQEVREQAVFWLSQIDGEESVDILIEILKSPRHPELKEKAVFALSQHGSRRAAESLKSAVLDATLSDSVREQAIFWLGQNDAPGTGLFLEELYRKLSSVDLKKKVIFSMSQMESEESRTWLLSIVRNENEDVDLRKDALFWAGQQGHISRTEMDRLWRESKSVELKEQIIFVLSQQDDATAIDMLIHIARTEKNVELRKKAVFWLGQSDDERALKFLEQLINE